MMQARGLSVIIPVWNDLAGLARLLPQLLGVRQVVQVIIADDASDPPVSPETLGLPELDDDSRLTWVRSAVQRGAGHARNQGLEHVRSSHVLYFDADDQLLPDFSRLLDDLLVPDGPDFDFCIFRHVDSRQRVQGRPGPLDTDQLHWELARIADRPAQLHPEQAARLARVSAYPWNKIYRTAFLRETGIRCTEIPVHNDIELHWRSFFQADRILASARLCAEHFVQEGGKRLTNQSGADRFEVFRALNPLQADFASDPRRMMLYATGLADFYLNLFHWIGTGLDRALQPAFHWKAQGFLRAGIDLPFFTVIALQDAELARRMNDFLTRDTV